MRRREAPSRSPLRRDSARGLLPQPKIQASPSGTLPRANGGGLGWGRNEQIGANRFEHYIESAVNILIREPNHPKSTLLEPSRPRLVVLFLRSMRVTVHLDDELRSGTVEVHDERTDGVLVSEREALDLARS